MTTVRHMPRRVSPFPSRKPSRRLDESHIQSRVADEDAYRRNPRSSREAGGKRESDRAVVRICDSILQRLNRIELEHVGSGDTDVASSSLTPIASSNPVAEEAEEKPSGSVQKETREWLLQQLRRIFEIAMQRVTNPKTPAPDRIKWSRIVIAAGQALNGILRDIEIGELRQQINELKALTLARLGEDEQGEGQTRDRETPASD